MRMKKGESGLFGFWLRFGSVTGRFGHAPSPKPRQNPKILAPHRLHLFFNALNIRIERELVSPAPLRRVYTCLLSMRSHDIGTRKCPMSRLKNFSRNLTTSYLQMGVNVLRIPSFQCRSSCTGCRKRNSVSGLCWSSLWFTPICWTWASIRQSHVS